MPHCITFFDTPELTEIVSSLLEKADLARLCRASKSLRIVFRPRLWRHYIINDRKISSNEVYYVLMNAHLVRVLDIVNPTAVNDAEVWALAGGLDIGSCTQLTHLTLRKNDTFLTSYTSINWGILSSVLFLLNRNHSLRQLNLATRLVLDYSHLFLKAFLALENLESLRVEMISMAPTFPTALNMAVTLLDQHPRLEHLLFGDWLGGVDVSDWVKLDYEEDYDDDFLGKDCKSEVEAMKAIEERSVEGTGTTSANPFIAYRRIRTIELPPRRSLPYPMSFLKTVFGEGLFPNLSKLQLPNAEIASTPLEILRVGCPRLKSMVHQSIHRGSAQVRVRRSFPMVIVSDED